ncbi:MAG: rhombosortase [Gammaproteobacteria bacterium]|nr:MAG: rhombosortase [Pseudomonadota bacterium]PIE38164.1 MAG: rhombosortase [Gammaproteobacteria bacterium]
MRSFMVSVKNRLAAGSGFHPANGIALVVALLMLAVMVRPDGARQSLRFEHAEIVSGFEWYRLISGHFVHLGSNHLILNVIGWLLIWRLFLYGLSAWHLVGILVLYPLTISLGLLSLHTIDWYVGFSGVLYGCLVFGILIGSLAWWQKAALIIGIIGKSACDAWPGGNASTAVLIGGNVLWQAHVWGCIVGMGHFVVMQLPGIRVRPGCD